MVQILTLDDDAQVRPVLLSSVHKESPIRNFA
jgi:hypothetical protein